MNAVISVHGLVKDYRSWRRSVRALDGVDLEVGRGEVFGLLGTNGAGKTTLVKTLLGLTRPTGGQVRIRGVDPGRPRARLRVGYLPEGHRFPGYLSGVAALPLNPATVQHMPAGPPRAEAGGPGSSSRSRAPRVVGGPCAPGWAPPGEPHGDNVGTGCTPAPRGRGYHGGLEHSMNVTDIGRRHRRTVAAATLGGLLEAGLAVAQAGGFRVLLAGVRECVTRAPHRREEARRPDGGALRAGLSLLSASGGGRRAPQGLRPLRWRPEPGTG